MNVAIVGGAGTVGREAADALRRRGHAVQVLRRFADKAAQEEVVRTGRAPFTILRATLVHGHLAERLRRAARFGVLPCGPLRLQPLAAAEVGRALADIAEADPSGAVTRLAGPEILSLTELGRQWRAAAGAHALARPLPLPGAAGRALRAGALTDPAAWRGRVRFAEWLGRPAPAEIVRAAA